MALGQLGETRLDAAIDADIAGTIARARSLDKDTSGSLRDVHRRVGTAILFESSGGQVDKVAHLPELRFTLGEPEIETTSIDNAAMALESLAFFIRKVGTDGYRIHHQATLKKVVSDRQASLDEQTEIRPAIRKLVEGEFKSGTTLPVVFFPEDSTAVQDSPRLSLVVLDPETEWQDDGQVAERIGLWTRERGRSPRLYPGSLVWCVRKEGRELRRKVELWLAWQRVRQELSQGILGTEYARTDHQEVEARIKEMHDAARDEVWASYRFVALWDNQKKGGLRIIDLGAGHSSASETLCGRIVTALRAEALLNENVGAGYVERHWPPAFQESGAWPLTSLRQSFLNGVLTRLVDPDATLRRQIIEFVTRGDFGLASGVGKDGGFERLWYAEPVRAEEVAFETNVFLVTKAKSTANKAINEGPSPAQAGTIPSQESQQMSGAEPAPALLPATPGVQAGQKTKLRLSGTVPVEVWNRLGTKILPKLRSGEDLKVSIEFSVNLNSQFVRNTEMELKQILEELGLSERIRIDRS